MEETLHKKWSFSLKIASVNVTKFAISCGFGHIYRRNLLWKTSFFVQWNWCFRCCYNFRKAKSYFINFSIALVKNGRCHLRNGNLKLAVFQEWINEFSWFFICFSEVTIFGYTTNVTAQLLILNTGDPIRMYMLSLKYLELLFL